MINFFLLNIVFFISLQTRAQVFIGNSGEGILRNGNLVLLDLFENGSDENPYMGNDIHGRYLSKIKDSELVFSLGIEAPLLAKKLTDIDHIMPFVGDFITEAMLSYRWVLTDQDLIGECAPQCPKDRIQLAVRSMKTILLSRTGWENLSAEQRVALVVHEIFYGFSAVECRGGSDCRQLREKTRRFVGQLFQQREHRSDQLLKAQLIFDFSFIDLEQFIQKNPIMLTISAFGSSLTSSKVLLSKNVLSSCANEDLFSQIEKFCKTDYASLPEEAPLLVMDLIYPQIYRSEKPYTARFGSQIQLSATALQKRARVSWVLVSKRKCTQTLQDRVNLILNSRPFPRQYPLTEICKPRP